MAGLKAGEEARVARLRLARERERKARRDGGVGGGMFRKKARVSAGEDQESSKGDGEDQFLPDDGDVQEDTNLSAEVRALMAQLAPKDVEEEADEDVPKVGLSCWHSDLTRPGLLCLANPLATPPTHRRAAQDDVSGR